MRTRVQVDTHRQCLGCGRALNESNELMDSSGKPMGWCGFCKPSSKKKAKAKHKAVDQTTVDFGKDLTVKVGATASRSFRKSVEPADSMLRRVAEDHAGKLHEWPAFTRETFARLYDERNCKPLPERDVSGWGMQAAGVLERQPEWPMMREASQAHRSIAADVGAKLSAAVAEAMGVDRMPEGGDSAIDPREIEAMKKALRDLLKQQGLSDEEIDNHSAMENANQQEHLADKARQQLQSNLASASKRGALRKVMKTLGAEAQEKAEAVRSMAGMGIGTGTGGNDTESIPTELIDVVTKDKMLLKILKEIGRMQEALSASGKARLADGNCDVIGVRPDDDLGRLLPFERAKLVHSPHTRREVIARVLDKQATCWELKGEENRNEGDLVLLVDRSGSMHGDEIVWARALAGAMMVLAARDGRRVALVMFDSSAEGQVVDEKSKLGDAFKLLSLAPRGGTNIDAALAVADKLIPELRDPDCVVISDGHFHMKDEYVAKVKENEGRLFAIMLGSASLDDDRFDKMWAPDMNADDAASILAEVRR